MEALAAIGLACTIVQFIDFSSKIVAGATKIYSSGAGTIPELEDSDIVSQRLRSLAQRLRDPVADSLVPNEETNLLSLRTKCVELCDDLQNLVQKTKISRAGSKTAALRASWRMIRQKERLTSLQARLDRYRIQILGHLLEMMR